MTDISHHSNSLQTSECSSTYQLPSENNATVISENVLLLGATGLTGSRILKSLARTVPPHSTIYVLSRSKVVPERPNVVVKVCEAATWPEEISKLPNISTVYTALAARPLHRFLREFTPFDDQFYEINHDLNYQVAQASRDAGVSTFVIISTSLASYPISLLLSRRVMMYYEIEQDMIALNFPHLVIMRSGLMVGIRAKNGSLKNFSLYSIIDGALIVAQSPLMFASWVTPFNIFNFSSSVAKAAVVVVNDPDGSPVRYIYPWGIIYYASRFNAELGSRILGEVKTISSRSGDKDTALSNLYKLFLGEVSPLDV